MAEWDESRIKAIEGVIKTHTEQIKELSDKQIDTKETIIKMDTKMDQLIDKQETFNGEMKSLQIEVRNISAKPGKMYDRFMNKLFDIGVAGTILYLLNQAFPFIFNK